MGSVSALIPMLRLVSMHLFYSSLLSYDCVSITYTGNVRGIVLESWEHPPELHRNYDTSGQILSVVGSVFRLYFGEVLGMKL